MEGLCSRMASAKLGSASSSLYISPEDVSYQYWSSCCLNYDDQVSDGFYEVFGEFPEAVTSKDDFPILAALHRVLPKTEARREVILFDSHSDPILRSVVEEARAALESISCTPDAQPIACHRQLSLVVAGRLGGPQPKVRDLSAPSLKHIEQLQTNSRSVVVPIGQVFIGSVRHRALLYKYLADIFGLKCRIMKGRFYANGEDDARLIVDANNGEEYEMDLMTRPGTSSPLEKRLALRASSREVAGTDVFSRASSVGGSTAGTANTAPASRSQSNAENIDSIQALTAAADAAIVAEITAQAPAQAEAVGPDPISTPKPPLEGGGLPPSLGDVQTATTLEQAMQMAAAAAMGQAFTSPYAGTALESGGLSSPFANAPSEDPPMLPPRMSFDGGAGRYSSKISSPYDNPDAQGWPGQPSGFGSLMPFQSVRSSAPYTYTPGEFSEPIRLSMGPNVGAGGANSAGGGDVQVEEMGPAALISDASGQQYILQPVRASMDCSYMRPSMDKQSSLTNRMSSEPPGVVAAVQRPGSGDGAAIATANDVFSSGSVLSAQQMSAAEVLKKSNIAAGLAPNRSSVPDASILGRSFDSSGGLLGSRTSMTRAMPDAAAMQWAAMQATGGNIGGPGGPSSAGSAQQQQHMYKNESTNLDNMGYGNNDTDVVSRLYLDSFRANSVRMSVPIELEARQALLTRPFAGSSLATDAATAAVTAADQYRQGRASMDVTNSRPTSRSSGDGVPFPPPEMPHGIYTGGTHRQQSGNLYTPFGAIDGALNGSESDTLSPKSSNGALSPETSLRQKAVTAARATAAAARAPSVAHNALPDLRDYNFSTGVMSPSTMSSLLSGEGYLQSLDSRDLVDDGWEIDADELQLNNRIGIGSYGEVYRGQWRQTDVAIKVFLEQDLGARLLSSFIKEVAIMKKLRHPNIVQFMGACSKPPNLCIVTQYVTRGSLFKLLHRSEGALTVNMDERRRLQMALDVARGMNYLHTCRPPVIHRDLKSPNLLVEKDMTIKVCDFGLSRVRHATVLSAKSQAGTPEWTAPEVLQGKSCNEASDVYSFGVILWELQTGEEPWTDKSAMQVVGAVGFANERLPIPPGIRPGLGDLMARCFGIPEDRPSFSEIISILKRQIRALVAAGPAAKLAAAVAGTAPASSDQSSGDVVQ
ncbi:hypothetical protein KSW81_003576 [Nannochloris sp. 'desiccata']|nr:hypothetical protein KSW81_003576 [Chlorella desiccata (nom. nud.)]